MRLAFVTATRAEYGLLQRLMRCVQADPECELLLYVTGAHLREEFGASYREILEDGLPVRRFVEIFDQDEAKACFAGLRDLSENSLPALRILAGETKDAVSAPYRDRSLSVLEEEKGGDDTAQLEKESMRRINRASALALFKFSEIFLEDAPDALVLLGDRYELLPIANAAMNLRLPLIHIGGGEISRGAVDDMVRHALTKLSLLHFPSEEEFRQRLLRMGESAARVFCHGDTGVENILKLPELPIGTLLTSLGLEAELPYYLITFHPATGISLQDNLAQLERLLTVLREQAGECQFIFTGVNADHGHETLAERVRAFVEEFPHAVLFDSLGILRYVNLMRHTLAVLGNSSSGLIEAPAVGVPTVNIGLRQADRKAPASVLQASSEGEIRAALRKVRDPEFRHLCKESRECSLSRNTAADILASIKAYVDRCRPLSVMKEFAD